MTSHANRYHSPPQKPPVSPSQGVPGQKGKEPMKELPENHVIVEPKGPMPGLKYRAKGTDHQWEEWPHETVVAFDIARFDFCAPAPTEKGTEGELAPCPFCGAKVKMQGDDYVSHPVSDCILSTDIISLSGWNRRTPSREAVEGGWVNIEEARPEKMGYYLAACEGGHVDKSFYDPTAKLTELKLGRKECGKWGRYFDLAQRGYRITHWMQIPAHPARQPKGAQR